MEEVKDKVEKIEALAMGTLEGTTYFMEEIKLVELEYKKGFEKIKKKVDTNTLKLDKIIKLLEKILCQI